MKTSISEQELEQFEELLKGETNPLREYVITLGQSNGSKGVMFVLYSYLKKCESAYANPAVYLGTLSSDFETAVLKARQRVPKFQINIEEYETFRNRLRPCVMPFGKYKNQTIEEIFEQDEKYLFWLSGSDSIMYIKSQTTIDIVRQYAEIAKENIVVANREASNPALELETALVERKLTVYSYKLEEVPSYSGYGNDYTETYKMKDEFGNKFVYRGKSSKLDRDTKEITLKCRVVDSFESLGVTFNKIKLTKGK